MIRFRFISKSEKHPVFLFIRLVNISSTFNSSLMIQAAIQIGRYIVTMMSTGVVLAVGFQLSG
jgi:hypothetical protein